MIKGFLLLVMVLLPVACAPVPSGVELTEVCERRLSAVEVVERHWLSGTEVWRMRQSALLELRGRKIPLEGFMVLDLREQWLHLIAMNEMGLVFFELVVTPTGQELRRALPQLQQQRGLAEGIAGSLRRIYLEPRADADDRFRITDTALRLTAALTDGEVDFVFDCYGRLRETRQVTADDNWRVLYRDFQPVAGREVPERIVFTDFSHGVSLTLQQREISLTP